MAVLLCNGCFNWVATFIENEYDTITAKMVYNAKWFDLFISSSLNFINNIKTYKLLKWKK